VDHYCYCQQESNLQYREIIRQCTTANKAKILFKREIAKLSPDQERGSYRWRKELNDIILKYTDIGGEVKNWDSIKDSIMLKAIQHKFNQHEQYKKILLDTKDATLIDDTYHDKNDKDKNKVGLMLMQVRSELLNNTSYMKDIDDDLFNSIDLNSIQKSKNDADDDDFLFNNIDLESIEKKHKLDKNNNNIEENGNNHNKKIKIDNDNNNIPIVKIGSIDENGKQLEKDLNSGTPATILRFAPLNTQKNNLISTIGYAQTVAYFNTLAKFGMNISSLYSEVKIAFMDEMGVESETELYEWLLNLQKLPTLQRIVCSGDQYQLASISGGNVLQDFLECQLFNVIHLLNNHRIDADAKQLFRIVKWINQGKTAFIPSGPDEAVDSNIKCFQLRPHNLKIFERSCEHSKAYYEEMAEKILNDPVNVQGIAYTNNWCDWLNLKVKEKAGWMKQSLLGNGTAENSILREQFNIMDDENYVPPDINDKISLEELTKRKTKNQVRFKTNDTINYLKNDNLHVHEKVILIGGLTYKLPDWLIEKEPHLQNKYVIANNSIGIIRKIVSYHNKAIDQPPKEYKDIAYLPNNFSHSNIIYLQMIDKNLQKMCKEKFPGKTNAHLLLEDEKQWVPVIWKNEYIERFYPAYWITTYKYQSLQAKTILHVIESFTTRKSLTTTVGRASMEYICFCNNKNLTVYEQFKKAIQNVDPERITLLKVVLSQLLLKQQQQQQ